jgi:hypothetical protein
MNFMNRIKQLKKTKGKSQIADILDKCPTST